MRTYGRIETSFWQNPKVRALSSDESRHLLLYLYTCPHGNSLGCFVLPDGYIMADLNWPFETLAQRFLELVAKGFIERDEASFLVRIVGWFGHNKIENRNVAQGAMKIISALPRGDILDHLLADLFAIDNKFLTPLLNESGNRPECVAKRSESPEPEPEPKPEPEQAGALGALPPARQAGHRNGARLPQNWALSPDDFAFAAGHHIPQHRAAAIHHSHHGNLKGGLELLGAQFEKPAANHRRRVLDQHIGRPQVLADRREGLGHFLLRRQVDTQPDPAFVTTALDRAVVLRRGIVDSR